MSPPFRPQNITKMHFWKGDKPWHCKLYRHLTICAFCAKQKSHGEDTSTAIPNGTPVRRTHDGVGWGKGPLTKAKFTMNEFVAINLKPTPPKFFNIYRVKGCIRVGADADLVIWNPAAQRRFFREKRITRKLNTVFFRRHLEISWWFLKNHCLCNGKLCMHNQIPWWLNRVKGKIT